MSDLNRGPIPEADPAPVTVRPALKAPAADGGSDAVAQAASHLHPGLRPTSLEGSELRLLTEPDLPAYKALRDGMLARHEHAFTSDAATEQTRQAASYRHRLHPEAGGRALFTLGAWSGDRLVGALTCEAEGRQKVQHIAHLVGMMVDDAQQGRGIGRALLQEALSRLRHEPWLELVTLSVTASNAPAVALYRSMGFVCYGHLPRAVRLADGRYLAKELMCLTLRSGDDGPNESLAERQAGGTSAL
ncbi:GNAT family N-acetyltransferase [Roseateles amylovorans]|uniref:GNAT family N-acetyltransferase n=1 Tax=Roseateles amylovorans TaxID=2978473 RepID=A0ABY6B3Z8_9BURK|nr:GNAT family N-acetyltransferase [Roseateles amylovorans]UXH79914.1 GNAT family N-acetyltransferase [Roseateles amylovorans]